MYFEEIHKLKAKNITLDELTAKNIEDFLRWLREERNNSPKTCNQRLGAIHSFFTYLQFEQPDRMLQCKQVLEIKCMKAAEPAINYLTVDGIKALLAEPDTSTKYGRRDLAILSVMYDTGARVQEIANIRYCDIRFISPATIILTGKGNKSRIVPLLPQTREILKRYTEDFRIRERGPESPLFLNRKSERMTRFGIDYILKSYADAAREKNPELIPKVISPHCIRHSKAMHLLQANVNLVYAYCAVEKCHN